jgi:transcriptional regulator with XRE-family HTH domain
MSMQALAEYDPANVGNLLGWWRKRRGFSQMALAYKADISPRHMSFVETGRSRPGREVLMRPVEALDLPLHERNILFERAGYARFYRESSLSDSDLNRLREILAFMVRQYEPYGAVVVDAEWTLIMANRAHCRLTEYILGHQAHADTEEPNVLLHLFRPGGLKEKLSNWAEVAHHILERLRRQVAENPSRERLRMLLETLESYDLPPTPLAPMPRLPVLPMHFMVGDVELRLLSLITTFGAPQDVTVQELRLEAFLPADEKTDRAIRALVCPALHADNSEVPEIGAGTLSRT